MKQTPSIWLFRDHKKDDPFSEVFSSSGFSVRCVSVLTTEYVPTPIELPSAIDAVVVTSQRSVEALARRRHIIDRICASRPSLPWFVSGPTTEGKLTGLGLPLCIQSCGGASVEDNPANGEQGGSLASNLAKCIVASGARDVLYLAGEPHRPELPGLLSEAGINVQIRTLYHTIPLVPAVLAAMIAENAPGQPGRNTPPETTSNELPDWVAFFSPRGVATVLGSQDVEWSGVKIAAIGPTTAHELRRQGVVPDAVAPGPKPESLLEAILAFDHRYDEAMTPR